MKKIALLVTALCLCNICYSQVTIGSVAPPVKGALLDLKETDNQDGKANSTKGLALPRVLLTSRNTLIDVGVTDAAYPKPEYTGLVVYNTGDDYSYCTELFPGLYTWAESTWIPMIATPYLGGNEVKVFVDNRIPSKPQEYKYKSFGKAGVWMTENLRTQHAPNGKPLNSNMDIESGGWIRSIPSYIVPQTLAPHPAMPETDPTNVATWRKEMGLLYNWAAATVNASGTLGAGGSDGRGAEINEEGTGEGTRKQGICPPGWHLPSDKEWTLLENEIIRNTSLYTYNKADISKTDTIKVTAPVAPNAVSYANRGSHGLAMLDFCSLPRAKPAPGASKKAIHGGFAVITAGMYTTYGGWNDENCSYMWTSSQSRKGSAWYRALRHNVSYVKQAPTLGADDVHMFFTVRCKQD